jgi:MOSC domain-containing protein YiiM
MSVVVESVSRGRRHGFSKPSELLIHLVAGHGVEGDAHFGPTVRHVHQVKQNRNRPNLRQVHLLHAELFDELRELGFSVGPGDLGENITTRGLDLLGLPRGTRLRIGRQAIVEVTGLRSPCSQIERFQKGLLAAVLDRDAEGGVVRKSGVMSVVLTGGDVAPGDAIEVELPGLPHQRLEPV